MTNLLFSLAFIPCLLLNCALSLSPFSERIPAKRVRLIYGVYILLCISTICLFYFLAVSGAVSFSLIKYTILAWAALVTAAPILAYPKYTQEYIFSSALSTLLNYLLGAFSAFFTCRFFGWDKIEAYICVELLASAFSAIFYYPIRRLIVNTVRPFLSYKRSTYWRSVFLLPVTMLLACYFMLPGNKHMVSFNQVLSRLFMVVSAFFICSSMSKELSLYQEKQAMAEQLRQQKLYYSQMGLDLEHARRQRHDFKHHLATIQYYIETDNKEGLREYCGELLTQNEIQYPIPYSGNSAADGVIYHFIQQSNAHQVHFSYQGTICSDGIADTDLCVLLGNALDNAMNGCMTVSENRFIRLTAQSEKQLLSLLIQNSFDGIVEESEKGGLLSRKRKNREGIGVSSMDAVCKQYGGTMERSWDANTFTLCVLLPLTPQAD